jgi:hypothetical protein
MLHSRHGRLDLIAAIQSELRRRSWDTFVDGPPSIAHGGRGVVVVGCPACRKTLYTVSQFIEHLARDVVPKIIETSEITTR